MPAVKALKMTVLIFIPQLPLAGDAASAEGPPSTTTLRNMPLSAW